MINKVVHLADIHIRKSLKRHSEYKLVLQRTIDSIKKDNPDRIVIVGDIYHDFIDIEGEALVIATWFIKELSKIAQVIITRGNHDFMKKNQKRYDVVKTITEMINEPNILYLEETGFFVDDNIVWTVWHHPDKQGPWKTINHKKEEEKTYIDLFHDPVKSCMTPLGWPLEKGVHITIDDFEGDIGMFGDIHLQQNMDGDCKKAYSGSLIQQSFDEKIDGHGYLLWDISEQTYELIEIENDYRHIEIVINGDIDYDKLDIKLDKTFPNMYFKVKWFDTRSNIHRINQSKIREYLKDNYNPIDIKWDKNILKNSEMQVDDELRKNINEAETQRKVFREYLTELGYDDKYIEEVLSLDDTITNRLPVKESEFSDYQIEALWLDNFKSYDENNLINWKDNNGIIQITGENQAGKTTILDGICYVLFGKTLSTLKKQKHGDSRFINNKNNLDYCSGWIVLKINEKRFLLKRSTGRKMHSVEKRVTSVTTEFHIYDLIDLNIDEITLETIEKLDVNDSITGERFLDTQKEIEKSIGVFEDFIRVVLVNADNLNDLLSINRSDFIDTVMRYAGYTIFENKLEEFKEYKKEQSRKVEKIVLDLDEEYTTIKTFKDDIKVLENDIKENEDSIDLKQIEKKKEESNKEDLLRNLIKVSEDIENFDPTKSQEKIYFINDKIKSRENIIVDLEKQIFNLTSDEDIEKYRNDIKKLEDTIEKEDEKRNSIREELSKYLSEKQTKESNIVLEEKDKNSTISTIENKIKGELSETNIKISSLNNEVSYVINGAKKLKKEIDELESSKVCTMCDQTLKEDSINKIKESIDKKKNELSLLKDNHTSKSKEIKELESNKKILEESLKDISSSDEVKMINEKFNNSKDIINNDIDKINNKIKDKESLVLESNSLVTDIKNKITDFKVLIEDSSKKIDLKQTIQSNNIKIDQYNLNIKEELSNIKLFEANKKSLEHNKKINDSIKDINFRIDEFTVFIDNLNNKLNVLNNDKNYKIKEIENKEVRIEKYIKQVTLEETYKIYQKCIHRDGIPTMLLRRSVDVINDEMSTILQDQDYICYFDEDLNLMMSHLNKLSMSQNAIESSGKERTFIALALKLALREINNTSRPNLILLDELMGKLINESVEQFITMLDRIKENIDKVVIIEHNHVINFDWQIHVTKNEKGISKCELI